MKKEFLHKGNASFVLPFIIVTTCFALWGFANDITNPMVKSFSKIFRMDVADGTLVQVAFYGGYFAMALPAALFIRRFSYKTGILIGLALYAIGAFLFFPAKASGSFYPFLIAYFILTCGLSFLETSSNPFILSMGEQEDATRRLNLAQSFNPIGSLCGMFVAMNFIQARMNPMSTAERANLDEAEFEMLKQADLTILMKPYIAIGLVLVTIFLLVLFFVKVPSVEKSHDARELKILPTFGRLFRNKAYRRGVIAQFFYVGAQITCWTFIIQYGTRVFMAEGMTEVAAEMLSQRLNIIAMVLFCGSRFLCTWLMQYVQPRKLLSLFAALGIASLLLAIFVGGRSGIYALVATSAFMSLMFPTIYALALNNVGDDAEIGSSGLIMAILGGSLLPWLQAAIIDREITWMPSVNLSFIVPLCCFVVVLWYGLTVKHLDEA